MHHSNDKPNEVILVDAKPSFPLKLQVRYDEDRLLDVLREEPTIIGIETSLETEKASTNDATQSGGEDSKAGV